MKDRVNLSTWKSGAAEQQFREREDELVRDLVAEQPEAIDVATHLGPTRVYRWPGVGVPIVFLHGTGGTGMTWARYAERRAGRSVYAVDTIGEVGRSRQEVAVENAAALASWLDEVLAGLGLDEVHLAGTSYGGFLALNLAAQRPARVRTVFVIEPAGVVRVRLGRFMAWGWCVLLSSLLPGPPRRVAAKWLRMPALEDRRLLRLGFYAARHHRKRLLRPEPLTDEQLRSITVPVTVVVGAKSEVFPPREVVARAALLPKVEVEIVDGAGHAAADSHVDQIASRLLGFAAR